MGDVLDIALQDGKQRRTSNSPSPVNLLKHLHNETVHDADNAAHQSTHNNTNKLGRRQKLRLTIARAIKLIEMCTKNSKSTQCSLTMTVIENKAHKILIPRPHIAATVDRVVLHAVEECLKHLFDEKSILRTSIHGQQCQQKRTQHLHGSTTTKETQQQPEV
jgi:hypothetical protein